jgi:GTP cyclohydrolase I
MNIHDDPDDLEYLAVMDLQQRVVSDEQFQRFEGHIAEIFSAFGMDLDTSSTKDTPRRFLQALF